MSVKRDFSGKVVSTQLSLPSEDLTYWSITRVSEPTLLELKTGKQYPDFVKITTNLGLLFQSSSFKIYI